MGVTTSLDFVCRHLRLANAVRAGRGGRYDQACAEPERLRNVFALRPRSIASLDDELVRFTWDERLAVEAGLNDLAGMSTNRAHAGWRRRSQFRRRQLDGRDLDVGHGP